MMSYLAIKRQTSEVEKERRASPEHVSSCSSEALCLNVHSSSMDRWKRTRRDYTAKVMYGVALKSVMC